MEDCLFPTVALLPLTSPGGVRVPLHHVPGPVRPFAATLAVPPVAWGKHSTKATRSTNTKATEQIVDGKRETDVISEVVTDD